MHTENLNLSLPAALQEAAKDLAGYWKLGLLLLAAWLLLFALAFLCRQLLREFSGGQRLKKGRVFLSGLLEGLVYTLLRLPKIVVALVLLFALSTLFELGSSIQDYISRRRQVEELTAVVKNLSRMEDVARITVLDDDLRTESGRLAKRYLIEILALDGSVLSRQTVAMEGAELFLDSVNINFDYSEIGGGKAVNVAYPYRVYTEKIPPAYGVLLSCVYSEEQIPLLFLLTDDDVYGIEKSRYGERLREIGRASCRERV